VNVALSTTVDVHVAADVAAVVESAVDTAQLSLSVDDGKRQLNRASLSGHTARVVGRASRMADIGRVVGGHQLLN
jgi:hypothetical protein